jgi:hypothetical protein
MVRTVRSSRTVLMVLMVSLGLGASAQADLFNGDFEIGGAGWDLGAVSASFKMFEGSGIALLYEDAAHDESDDGGYFNIASIEQDFLRPSTATQLCFDFQIHCDSEAPSETDHFQIVLSDGSADTLITIVSTDDPSLTCDTWHHVSQDISFLPAGTDWDTPNTLTFRLKAYDDDRFTTVRLDNVHLVPVPTAGLLALIGLACAARRTRRSSGDI